MKTVEVTYTVKYLAQIEVEDENQTVDEIIENLNIPEDQTSAYVCGSYEVEEVRIDEKRILKSRYDKPVAKAALT